MHHEPILIRQAEDCDLHSLVALLEILFAIEEDFTFAPERQLLGLQLLLATPAARVIVAEAAGRVVGMCSGQLLVSTAEGAMSLLVEDLVVEENYRGRGTGRRLLAAIAGWAADYGVCRLQLLADRHNLPALKFYERQGWQLSQLICLRKRQ